MLHLRFLRTARRRFFSFDVADSSGKVLTYVVVGFGVVYHPNPLDAGTIGELVQKHRATMMISTPSFCLGYTRKCTPEQFSSLCYAVVGAEKLREPIARAFEEKYGLELLEGYGCTQMSPAVAINTPCVVTAVPDESKGERLVAFHTSKGLSPEALWSRLCESSLPKLRIPKRENLYYIDAIPLLGTGKVDLKRVRALALEMVNGTA